MIFGRKQNEWNQLKWNEWLYSEVFMKFAIKIELKLGEHFPRRVNYIKIDHGHWEYNHSSYQILAIPIWRKGRVNPLNFIVICTLIILKIFNSSQSSIQMFFLFMSLMKNNKENAIFLESLPSLLPKIAVKVSYQLKYRKICWHLFHSSWIFFSGLLHRFSLARRLRIFPLNLKCTLSSNGIVDPKVCGNSLFIICMHAYHILDVMIHLSTTSSYALPFVKDEQNAMEIIIIKSENDC